jgi:hypothetical protein
MPTEKQLANLKPAQEGEVRNPKGRGKSKNRATTFRKWLRVRTKVEHPETGQELEASLEDKVVLSLITAATEEKNVQAAKEILDSVYGKSSQEVKVTGDANNPLSLKLEGLSFEQLFQLAYDRKP